MIEIELKTLLQTKENVNLFLSFFEGLEQVNFETQLNHYFIGEVNLDVVAALSPSMPKEYEHKLHSFLQSDIKSVRTRQIITEDPRDPKTLLIVKATLTQDSSSENGSIRKELEIPMNMGIDKLDSILIEYGLNIQSKWSRERTNYKYKDINISVDNNAGYGYVAELEKIIQDEDKEKMFEVKKYLHSILSQTPFEELCAGRLARMFDHYNNNWSLYYGTSKTFVME